MSQKALICDADGTLINSWNWTIGAALHTAKQLGLRVSREEFENTLLSGIHLQKFYETHTIGSGISVEKCMAFHREYQLRKDVMADITIYPGVAETLHLLSEKGVKLGIATSRKKQDMLLTTLQRFGINLCFGVILSLEDVKNAKPHPESIFLAMDLLEVEKENTFFIGDMVSDMEAGRNAGVTTIGALYGPSGEELRKAGADYFVHRFSEVQDLVLA